MTACAVALIAASTFAGPDWVEEVDAGNQIITAQPIVNIGTGPVLQRIVGQLTGAPVLAGAESDFDDIYQILITDPTLFVASTQDTKTNFQTFLCLFDSTGHGLLANVIGQTPVAGEVQGSLLLPFSTDGTEIFINKPGIYYLCISSSPRIPLGVVDGAAGLNAPIFNIQKLTEISGPDGAAGASPLVAWTGEGFTGSYEILVQGVGFIPAPGAMALLVVAFAGAGKRRRRR